MRHLVLWAAPDGQARLRSKSVPQHAAFASPVGQQEDLGGRVGLEGADGLAACRCTAGEGAPGAGRAQWVHAGTPLGMAFSSHGAPLRAVGPYWRKPSVPLQGLSIVWQAISPLVGRQSHCLAGPHPRWLSQSGFETASRPQAASP